ncbi:MAG: DUF975 family protein [Clostridium perfringens]|nr:DUF975 family protein [Clostridium perfringens]
MTSSELKKQSKLLLSKRWGNATVATFLFVALIQIVSYIFSIALIESPVASAIITFILSIGSIYLVLCFVNYCRKLKVTNEHIKFSECFVSLKQFLKYLVIAIILAIITIIIGVLISSLIFMSVLASKVAAIISILVLTVLILVLIALEILFFPLTYIIILKPEYTLGQIIKTSVKIGWKNSGEILYIILSFIGWNILSIITCGIGYLWTMPYMELTYISFIEEKIKQAE